MHLKENILVPLIIQCFINSSLMSNRGMNGDVMSGRNRRGGSKSRLLSPPPSSAGNNNTNAAVSNHVMNEGSMARVRGSSAERLLSPPPVSSSGAVNGHHGITIVMICLNIKISYSVYAAYLRHSLRLE